MKTAFFITLFLASAAHANYQCSGDNNAELTVQENRPTHLGNTRISLTVLGKNTAYYGTLKTDDSTLYVKKEVSLYPFQGDTLTILAEPRACGRGACNPGLLSITATLKVGGVESYFYCNETKI